LLQTRREFLIGKPLAFYFPERERATFYSHLLRKDLDRPLQRWQTMLYTPRGQIWHVEVAMTPALDPHHGNLELRWLLRNISPAKQVEAALLEMKRYSESLTDAVEAVVLLIDATGHILRTNAYTHSISGYPPESLLGKDWCELLLPEAEGPEARGMVQRALKEGAARTGVLAFRGHDVPERGIAWSARKVSVEFAPSRVVLLGHDVTGLQEVQNRLLQAERLAAVGQAMAGLAHESRNALQRSQACLEMLAAQVKDQPEALKQVQRIQRAQDDLHLLYEEVQGYAGPVQLKPQLADLADLWRAAWAELKTQRAGQDVHLHEERSGIDLRCVVSPFHMRRVFRNIFDNTLSVVQHPVRVVVRCMNTQLRGEAAVRIQIQDNGPGFSAEARSRAFEPFFTTKARGTGLGLSICRRIVEAHGGRIEIETTERPGAVISITLPRQRHI
jgi:hypothetical protein